MGFPALASRNFLIAQRFPALIVLDMSTSVLNGHQFLAAKAHDAILETFL
jgi:hypothetical protein